MISSDLSDILQLRQNIRASTLAIRDGLSSDARATHSARIIQQLVTSLGSARIIHTYVSFRSEVDTRGFIVDAIERGVQVAVPIVEEVGGRKELIHSEIRSLSHLRPGAFGVEEPVERIPVALETLDAVILPLAAFDRQGTRLGYGKGFYDGFLRALPRTIPRIGLAFAAQEVSHIPELSHDEPLDIVITEKEILHCG